MANETTVGELSINLKMKLEGLEKGLETARKKLQTLEEQNKKIESSNKSLDASYLAMSATAVLAIGKIVGIIKGATEEYKAYTQAMDSLSDVSDYTNQNLDDMSKLMSKYGNIMTKTDLATTIKILV